MTSRQVLSLSFFTNCTSRYQIKPQRINRALQNHIQVLKEFHQIRPPRYNRALQDHKQVVKQFLRLKRAPLSTSHYDPNTNGWRHLYRKADYKTQHKLLSRLNDMNTKFDCWQCENKWQAWFTRINDFMLSLHFYTNVDTVCGLHTAGCP